MHRSAEVHVQEAERLNLRVGKLLQQGSSVTLYLDASRNALYIAENESSPETRLSSKGSKLQPGFSVTMIPFPVDLSSSTISIRGCAFNWRMVTIVILSFLLAVCRETRQVYSLGQAVREWV